jgi:hypothetical protein
VLDHLEERGLVPARVLAVVEARELDGVVTVEDEGGRTHALGEVLARAVFVGREPAAQ